MASNNHWPIIKIKISSIAAKPEEIIYQLATYNTSA